MKHTDFNIRLDILTRDVINAIEEIADPKKVYKFEPFQMVTDSGINIVSLENHGVNIENDYDNETQENGLFELNIVELIYILELLETGKYEIA